MPIHTDISIEKYHKSAPNFLSKTTINHYRDNGPAWWKLAHLDRCIEIPRPDGAVQGLAIDCLLTEGQEAFLKRFPELPDDAPKRPSKSQVNAKKPAPATIDAIKWWNDFDAKFPNHEILSAKDQEILIDAVDAVRRLPCWKDIEQSKPQQTVRRLSDGLGLGLQSRPDWLSAERGITYDLKKARDLSRFGAQAIDLGYHLQAATGAWCLAGDGIQLEHAYLVAVEWQRGARARCYKIPDEALVAGDREMRDTAAQIARRLKENDWVDRQEEPEPLPIPGWLQVRLDEASA